MVVRPEESPGGQYEKNYTVFDNTDCSYSVVEYNNNKAVENIYGFSS